MLRSMIANLAARISLIVASALVASAVNAESGVYDDRIVFGQSAALDGPAAELGRGMRDGILAAFNETSQAGGVHGRSLELISYDDGYEPERAIANVERQIADAGSGGARGGEARRGDAERRGGGQGRRGGGQGRRGRFNMRPPSEMTAEQRDQWIEMMDRMVDRIADRVDEDRADALIKGFDKIKKLIKDKKLKEADKAVEEWRQLLFRRR